MASIVKLRLLKQWLGCCPGETIEISEVPSRHLVLHGIGEVIEGAQDTAIHKPEVTNVVHGPERTKRPYNRKVQIG